MDYRYRLLCRNEAFVKGLGVMGLVCRVDRLADLNNLLTLVVMQLYLLRRLVIKSITIYRELRLSSELLDL